MKKKKRKGPAVPAPKKRKDPETIPTLGRRSKNIDAAKLPYTIGAVLLVFLVAWRLTPRPLWAVLGTDQFASVSASVTRYGADGAEEGDGGDGGNRANGTEPAVHTLEASGPEGEAVISGLLDILNSTRYRPDLGNLWLMQSAGVTGTGRETALRVQLTLLGADGTARTVDFYQAKTMETGGRTFHPVDRTVQDRLAAYVEEHGTAYSADSAVSPEPADNSASNTADNTGAELS